MLELMQQMAAGSALLACETRKGMDYCLEHATGARDVVRTNVARGAMKEPRHLIVLQCDSRPWWRGRLTEKAVQLLEEYA